MTATMILLGVIGTAPMAGERTIPDGASTPAASGIATMSEPAAHQRLCALVP